MSGFVPASCKYCKATAAFTVTPINGKYEEMHACSRHLARLVQFRTVPGRAVVVIQIGGDHCPPATPETLEEAG